MQLIESKCGAVTTASSKSACQSSTHMHHEPYNLPSRQILPRPCDALAAMVFEAVETPIGFTTMKQIETGKWHLVPSTGAGQPRAALLTRRHSPLFTGIYSRYSSGLLKYNYVEDFVEAACVHVRVYM